MLKKPRSPDPVGQEPPWGGPSGGYYEEREGRSDNTRRKPPSARTRRGVGPRLCLAFRELLFCSVGRISQKYAVWPMPYTPPGPCLRLCWACKLCNEGRGGHPRVMGAPQGVPPPLLYILATRDTSIYEAALCRGRIARGYSTSAQERVLAGAESPGRGHWEGTSLEVGRL